MSFQFASGDRVCLTPAGISLYGGVSQWVPPSQGAGLPGTVLVAAERPFRPGAAPRPYFVRWDNGAENSYREEDLQASEEGRPDEATEEQAPNVITVKWGKG